jgi:hypothetical protein
VPGLEGGPAAGDRLLADLLEWAATERARRSAAERARTRALVDQSAAGATWAGLLVDLAERSAEVNLTLPGGRLSGRVVGVGSDFCVLDRTGRPPALVVLHAITLLSGAGGSPSPGGHRTPPVAMSLADALEALAGDRTPLTVHHGQDRVNATLVGLAVDFITLRADGDVGTTGAVLHVRLAAVSCCELR